MKSETSAMNEKTLNETEGRAKVAELIKGIRIAMLTTVEDSGELRSRPMATQDTDFDGTVYFLTKIQSEKVDEIRENSHVLLTYADTSSSKYVTLQGRAFVTRDQAKIDELWNPMAKAWFPDGKDDPTIAVIRVDVTGAEYWDANASKAVRIFKMATAALTDTIPNMGDHGRVKMAS